MKNKKVAAYAAILFLEILVLGVISSISNYHLVVPGNYVDLRVASMLTPAGLIQNLLLDPHSFLSRFYWQVPSREGVAQHFALLPLIAVFAAAAIFLLFALRRELKE